MGSGKDVDSNLLTRLWVAGAPGYVTNYSEGPDEGVGM